MTLSPPARAFAAQPRPHAGGDGDGAADSGGISGGGGGLPANVAFIFEGEEENGSRGFKEALEQNLRWFENTAAIVISNTQWVGEACPCLT